MGESVAEFMERQRRRVARFGREAEAAAHEAYGKATAGSVMYVPESEETGQ